MNILIVCQNRIFAGCLGKVLESSSVSCTFAQNRDESFCELEREPSEMIIVDHTGWSEESVLKLVHQIHEQFDQARVLVISGPDIDRGVTQYIEGGAVGFLTKEHSIEQLLDAIDCVLRHSAKCWVEQAALVFERLQELSRDRSRLSSSSEHPLTVREVDVLKLVDMGRSNKEIAVELHLSIHTVKSHVHRILEKAGASNRREAVYRALHSGWLDTPSK